MSRRRRLLASEFPPYRRRRSCTSSGTRTRALNLWVSSEQPSFGTDGSLASPSLARDPCEGFCLDLWLIGTICRFCAVLDRRDQDTSSYLLWHNALFERCHRHS